MKMNWLNDLENSFDRSGIAYGDLFYVLEAAMTADVIKFPDIIKDASNGIGVYAREGLSYSLDQDWDEPQNFDKVICFIGDIESSSLSIDSYIALMETAVNVYLSNFPDGKKRVMNSLARLKNKYLGK
ncbi:MAG: hypothetical protein VX447_16200 [Pseudomonadota bacterium]|uniref:hypothetical protein n=1 Tax=Gallaecimonas pentaromativorans TaxID=584787 RepID=UPI00067F2B5C|nr:hypothetical protein [Gallaecimonas pentaromativorans]MED5526277.1 hypothetical protein [Pseudomonadota bacterium]